MSQKITNFFAPVKAEILKEHRHCSVVVMDIKDDIQNGSYKGLEISNFPPKLERIGIEKSSKKEATQSISSYIKKIMSEENGNQKQVFECQVCFGKFAQNDGALYHIKKKHQQLFDSVLTKCPMCDAKFTQNWSLMRHTKAQNCGKSFALFECDFCEKKFNSKRSTRNHMRTHLLTIECHICHVELKQNSLHTHLYRTHAVEKKFKCRICPATFKSKPYQQSHEKSHDKKFECAICNKKFSKNVQLKKHQREYHENPGSYACKQCCKTFNSKLNWKSHQKVHDQLRPKPYSCQKCSYSTDSKQYYGKHQRSHQRQEDKFKAMKNPFKCEKCGKFSRNRQALYLHMRSVHPVICPQCDLCGNYIKTMNVLRKHIERHISKQNKR